MARLGRDARMRHCRERDGDGSKQSKHGGPSLALLETRRASAGLPHTRDAARGVGVPLGDGAASPSGMRGRAIRTIGWRCAGEESYLGMVPQMGHPGKWRYGGGILVVFESVRRGCSRLALWRSRPGADVEQASRQ